MSNECFIELWNFYSRLGALLVEWQIDWIGGSLLKFGKILLFYQWRTKGGGDRDIESVRWVKNSKNPTKRGAKIFLKSHFWRNAKIMIWPRATITFVTLLYSMLQWQNIKKTGGGGTQTASWRFDNKKLGLPQRAAQRLLITYQNTKPRWP